MKFLRGESQKPENDDCRVLAPYVMTLFDGEADEIEARRARAHLLVCQTCANRWLDWNRSRDLLLHSAPVPAPPPQLLWRVLMACRLSKAPQRAQATRQNSAAGSAVASSSSAQLSPAHLSAQILARTTRAGVTASVFAAGTRAPRRVFAPFKVSAFAAPALCVWMLLLQRDVWLTPIGPGPEAAVSDALLIQDAPRARVSAAKTGVPKRALRQKPVASRDSISGVASPLAPFEARVIRAPLQNLNAPTVVARSARPVEATPLAATQALRVIEASFGARADFEIRDAARFDAAPAGLAESEPSPAPRRAASRTAPVRLGALSSPRRAPRLRAARLASAPSLPTEMSGAARLAMSESPASPQVLRVALPSASAPQPARLLAEFDADDERIEAARSVVDEFRAAVDPEENGVETAPDDENTG